MFHLKIDGRECQFENTASVLNAAASVGIKIPSLCYDQRLEPYGGCRIFLVQVKGHQKPEASCTTPISDGMEILTSTDEIEGLRRNMIQLIMQDKDIDPETLDKRKEFYKLVKRYDVPANPHYSGPDQRKLFKDNSHPFLAVDMEKCIDCYRCVRICEELQGQFVWRKWNRGFNTVIMPDRDGTLLESSCVSCGACSDTCPTGAIEDRSIREYGYPEKLIRSVCPYCGTGCEINIGVTNDRIVEILPVMDSPVSKGHLCVKGRYSYSFVDSEERITEPMIKIGGVWKTVSWDAALDTVASEFQKILMENGPDSMGVLGSSRATNEENYLTQKFARTVLGTNNVDGCARVCHAPTAGGMGAVLGTGAATNSFDDIEKAKTFLIMGANPTENHPIVGSRIRQQVMKGSKLIVVDPRVTELASMADYHLQILPGTDVPLINAMAYTIMEENLTDAEFIRTRVSDFPSYREYMAQWTPERVSEICGIDADIIRQAARLYATGKPSMMFHGLGITEHIQGTEAVMDLVNLALITGNIGIPGSGVNPLRGQNNVQGSAHMGVEPSKLTGYIPLEKGYEDFEKVWHAKVPKNKGLDEMEMLDAALSGKMKALWIIGWDVSMTNPDSAVTDAALSKLDFIVVQDLSMNETARKFANVFLPAVSSYEKDGTFMNSERRIQRVRRAIEPRGNSRADWEIIQEVARRMGKGDLFAFSGPEDIWNEIRAVWPAGRGITYGRLEEKGIQWPCYDENHPGTAILHGESFTLGLTAGVRRIEYRPTEEKASPEYPIILTTGGSLFQFNSSTMTGKSGNNQLRESDIIQISNEDAENIGVSDGDPVKVTSRYGFAFLVCRVGTGVKKGVAFATFNNPLTHLNSITGPNRDNLQHTPEYKVTAIRVERISKMPSANA